MISCGLGLYQMPRLETNVHLRKIDNDLWEVYINKQKNPSTRIHREDTDGGLWVRGKYVCEAFSCVAFQRLYDCKHFALRLYTDVSLGGYVTGDMLATFLSGVGDIPAFVEATQVKWLDK